MEEKGSFDKHCSRGHKITMRRQKRSLQQTELFMTESTIIYHEAQKVFPD